MTAPHAHRPRKVAILHYASYPVIGGVESIMSTHARLLDKEGDMPYILTGRGNPHDLGHQGQVIPEIDSRHPEILEVQAALLAGESWAEEAFERWVERIYNLLRNALDGADACIVHNAFTLHKNLALTVALARLAERQGAARWLAWCHDLAWTNPLYSGELLPRWPWTVLKTRLPNVTYVAISEQRQAEMAGLFNMPLSSIHLVPNGIDPTAFIPTSVKMADLRQWLRWDERDCVLLAPVRITRRKNLELAIAVTAALRDRGCSPLLLVTGPPGPHNIRSNEYLQELMQQRLEARLEDEVVFLALEGERGAKLEVSDALMTELYWWSDVLLVTSIQEGFGLPTLEAGLVRMPIFCTDIPVLREVGGENAFYFQTTDDPAMIADMILNQLQGPGVAAMRRKVLSTYTWGMLFHSRLLPLLDEA
ncbi:MAG TPA: glycosyltransferase family 4 protein [Chloroflexia bacterium]